MKRALIVSVLIALLLTSCGAKMVLTGTAPVLDNAGTCANPILEAGPVGRPMVMHVAWSGRAAGEDSIATSAGASFVFEQPALPAGQYDVSVWFSDAGGVGCDTTLALRLGGPPWKPVFD